MNKFFRQWRRKFDKQRVQDVRFPAVLGNTSGVVKTDIAGIVYATKFNGQVIRVLNRRVANIPYKHVIIGYDPGQPSVLQVLGERNIFGIEDAATPDVPEHTHDYNSGMAQFVYDLTIIPFLVLPYEDFTVQVFGGAFIKRDGTPGIVANQQIDLSSYQPVSGAIWAVMEYDEDGTINIIESSSVAYRDLLTIDNIPTSPNYPLVAIRLYVNQAYLQRNPDGINDFVDLRFGLHRFFSDAEGDPEDITSGAADDGTSLFSARRDHVHHSDTEDGKYRRHVIVKEIGGGWSFVTLDDEPVMVLDELE